MNFTTDEVFAEMGKLYMTTVKLTQQLQQSLTIQEVSETGPEEEPTE